MPEWVIYILLVVAMLVGYLLATFLDRNTNIFKKISSWIIVPLPFIVLFVIGIPLLLVRPQLPFETIFYSVAFPTLFFCGLSVAIYIERYTKWRQRKLDKAKAAQNAFAKPTKETKTDLRKEK
ncbi:Uncharacterised protein [Mycoplasmopsis californica]|uniref:DUF2304 domain-containing protein n=1 Tax=Mycoplasmopsis equigenitalium TaxID=114883 RepID=A0ABY5J059_9BACT|nr:hypothetical protein [Mycoplasmopsis equigenitalium]UUD36662.1 hypothetical protein NPA09_01940 [Mycoplasmopsis equigenitalium]VEU69376.1 Uncharacterised protein [Mycoplasmopsis californica]